MRCAWLCAALPLRRPHTRRCVEDTGGAAYALGQAHVRHMPKKGGEPSRPSEQQAAVQRPHREVLLALCRTSQPLSPSWQQRPRTWPMTFGELLVVGALAVSVVSWDMLHLGEH